MTRSVKGPYSKLTCTDLYQAADTHTLTHTYIYITSERAFSVIDHIGGFPRTVSHGRKI